MAKYKVTQNLTIDGKDYVANDVVEMTEVDAKSDVDNGSLVLVAPKKSVNPSVPSANKDVAEKVSNEERNNNTGINTAGVNSPDPSVGDIVPVDIVMPGQVVDPKTGKVLDGGSSELTTPQPLPPTPQQSKDEMRKEKKAAHKAAGSNA